MSDTYDESDVLALRTVLDDQKREPHVIHHWPAVELQEEESEAFLVQWVTLAKAASIPQPRARFYVKMQAGVHLRVTVEELLKKRYVEGRG